MPKAFITGLAGTVLSPDETAFVREAKPAGLILFARNCASASQVRDLVAAFREAAGPDPVLVLVDQEGGRVQRLRPPVASLLPPAAAYLGAEGGCIARAARLARLGGRLAALDLKALGIDTDCAPVLDVPVPGAHDIIGNRAFAAMPDAVATLAGAFAAGLMAGGVVPVVKHIPGHGRAEADSHLELPHVSASHEDLLATDLVPFRALAHLPAAMTAHVVYSALDPSAPASTSARVTAEIIRGAIGFDGLLMSDDIGMRALAGPFAARAAAVLAAGSDLVLHCSGDFTEMRAVADAVPEIAGPSRARFQRACAVARQPAEPFAADEARAELERLLSRIA